jgi:hypothetical protein
VSACANDWGIPLNQHRENIGIFIHAFLIFLLWGHIVIWGTAFIRAARSFSSSTVVTIFIPSSPCNCFLHLYNYKLTYTILLFTVSLHLYSYYHPSFINFIWEVMFKYKKLNAINLSFREHSKKDRSGREHCWLTR